MEKEPGSKPKNQEELNKLADELDKLQMAYIKRTRFEGDIIPYINWIVQDLRKGDLETARANYNNQADKYSDKPEIKKFLQKHGIADKGIDWGAWKKADSD